MAANLAGAPQSPTPRLLLGLAATLSMVVVFSMWSLHTLTGLRKLQTDTIDRNRRDSLQLIRIQNDLNLLALAMRDMVDDRDGHGIQAWRGEFDRLREDLDDAVRLIMASEWPKEQRNYLASSLSHFWHSVDAIFAMAENGDVPGARRAIVNSLQGQQTSITNIIAKLLIRTNASEEQAVRAVRDIYDGVERNLYLFMTAMLAVTAGIGLLGAHRNRQIFDSIAALSQQRSTLARGLIGVQEEVFRSVSRELHDDFGQILTAIGAMVRRAGKHLPADSPLHEDLAEIRTVAQEALEKTRSFSQALHPSILDDYGLERAVERYTQTFSKQTGIPVKLEQSGSGSVPDSRAIHVFRVVQEALNNVARHSHATEAWVRLKFGSSRLAVEIADNGAGIPQKPVQGLGLIAMRERAELMGGTITVKRLSTCGTLVMLEVPLEE